jgi:hypothetical protein
MSDKLHKLIFEIVSEYEDDIPAYDKLIKECEDNAKAYRRSKKRTQARVERIIKSVRKLVSKK